MSDSYFDRLDAIRERAGWKRIDYENYRHKSLPRWTFHVEEGPAYVFRVTGTDDAGHRVERREAQRSDDGNLALLEAARLDALRATKP